MLINVQLIRLPDIAHVRDIMAYNPQCVCACVYVCVYLSECVRVCACWSLVMGTLYIHGTVNSFLPFRPLQTSHSHTHTDCTTYPELPTLNVADEHCTSTSSSE